ncbi:helix-turn-helix domain-containing protein [Virgibacillus salexigens]|uniref:helix-turn-helix domain-containing protein n=1 Tax=Virgibacillus salexigens TaxID=61016 RepID=UPI001909C530|nr:helix-turn-helix domain-containing protein [Virgibacillus salexigens]
MILKGIILYCVSQIETERSVSAVYYIITGKRSIQTVQDMHIYQLKNFFGIDTNIDKSDYDQLIQACEAEQLLIKVDDEKQLYRISRQGERWLVKENDQLYLNLFKGAQYGANSHTYFDRLRLLIQTLTNSKMGYFQFIPVIENKDVENWVKRNYSAIKPVTNQFLSKLYEELLQVLHRFPVEVAEMFVDRLTGYKSYGKSINQLAKQHNRSTKTVHLIITGFLHFLIDIVMKEEPFPILRFIAKDLTSSVYLTNTAQITHQFLHNGNTIQEIANERNLKVNTIYDHIVEIALYDSDFSIENYVSKADQQEIIEAFYQTNSYRLKTIKDFVDNRISYFQIRLVLAVLQNEVESNGSIS